MRRKILLLHRTLKQSGASRQLIYLYRGLDRSRFDPFFVLEHDRKLFFQEELANARIHVLSSDENGRWLANVRELVAILDRERPDCIQSFNTRSNAYLYAASLVRKLPLLYCSVRNTHQPLRMRATELLFQGRHRALVVNSRGVQDHLVRSGVNARRIRLIHNGIDLEKFTPCDPERRSALRREYGSNDDEFLVLSVGRVDPQKDIRTTLEAISALAKRGVPVRFLNVGLNHKPDYREELLAFAQERGIAASCTFLDPIENIVDFYHMADAMVLASFFEGLPNVLLENMASGGVSITSTAADNDRVVEDGSNGFRFAVRDGLDLAEKLEYVYRLGHTERSIIGSRARKEMMERFSMDRMVRAFEDLYTSD